MRKQKKTEEPKPGPDKEMTEPDKKMEEVSPEVAMNDADQARSSHEPPPGWEDAEQARSSHEPPPEAKAKASPKAKQNKKREETAGPSDRAKRTKKAKRPSDGDIESEVKRLRNEENVEAPTAEITPTENEVTGGNAEENQVEIPANDQVATEESPGENTAELEFDGEVQPEETPGEPEGDFDDDLERLMPEDENVNKLEELEKFFDTSHKYDEFFDEVDDDTGTNIRFERHAYEQDEEFIAIVNECQNEINEELRHRADEIHANKMFDTVLEVDDMAKNTWKFIQGQGWTDTRDILKLEQITGREIPEKHTWNSLGDAARKREVDSYLSYDAILKLDYRAVPRDAQILGARFVYTIKDDPVELGKKPGLSHLDEFRRLDARLCVQGYPEELDEDVQSPTANLETLRVILGIAAIRNYDFGVIDISRAYLQSEDLKRDVYVTPPYGVEKDENIVWKAKKPLYGLSDSTKNWAVTVMKWMAEIGGKKCQADPGLHVFSSFKLENWSRMNYETKGRVKEMKYEWTMRPDLDEQGEKGIVHGLTMIHVDDLLYIGTPKFVHWFEESLQLRFKCKMPDRNDVKYLGMRIKKLRSGTFELSSNGYERCIKPITLNEGRTSELDSLLNEKEEGDFRALLGKLMWLARITRGDIATDVAHIAQVYKNGRRIEQSYDFSEILVVDDPESEVKVQEWSPVREKTTGNDHMPGFDDIEHVNKINLNKPKKPKNKGKNFSTSLTIQNIVALNKCVRKVLMRPDAKVRFTDVTKGRGIDDVGILIYSDGALMNTVEKRSQIGCVAMLVSNTRPRKIVSAESLKKDMDVYPIIDAVPILWKSQKSPRVANSSHSAELQAMFMALDIGCITRTLVSECLFGNANRVVSVDLRNDNLNVIRAVNMLGNTPQEKRLQGIIESMKEILFSGEVTTISYTPGIINAADELTKITPGNQLHVLLMNNRIRCPSEEILFQKFMRAHNNKQYLLLKKRYPELNWG